MASSVDCSRDGGGIDDGEGNTENRVRLRSKVACRTCNHRKVRCNVSQVGIPCSNCSNDSAACEVLPRKKHRQVVSKEQEGRDSC